MITFAFRSANRSQYFILIVFLTLLIGHKSNAQAPRVSSDSVLKFIVVGDWGEKASVGQKTVAAAMAKSAGNNLGFVISTGDNFYDAGVADVRDSQWIKTFKRVYNQPSLQVPWFPVLGNHDYLMNPDAQIEYSRIQERWQMPARYYAKKLLVQSDSVLILFIDTEPIEQMLRKRPADSIRFPAGYVEQQMKWIALVLSSSHAKWKLVIGHHPLHTGGARRHSSRTKKMRNFLSPLFEKKNVDLYFSGHEHHLEYLQPRGFTKYVVSGAGSHTSHLGYLKRFRRFAAKKRGFVECSISSSSIVLKFIDGSNNLLYETILSK